MSDNSNLDEQHVIVNVTRPSAVPKKSEPKRKRQPKYTVIVLDDDVHTYAYVIDALSQIWGHSLEQAYHLAHQIDTTGRAAVWVGAMEVAELKRDQIISYGPDVYASNPDVFPLGCYIEPVA